MTLSLKATTHTPLSRLQWPFKKENVMGFLGAIWAQSLDGIIGDGSDMPWHVPEDLAHFKQVTMGSPVIMGRRTWESLPQRFRPLPGRENYIISSHDPGEWSLGGHVLHGVDAIDSIDEAWIMGGGQIYAATLDQVDRLEVTLMGAHIGDALGDKAVHAPDIPAHFSVVHDSGWHTSDKGHLALPGHEPSDLPLKYRFLSYERKDAA